MGVEQRETGDTCKYREESASQVGGDGKPRGRTQGQQCSSVSPSTSYYLFTLEVKHIENKRDYI